MITKFLPLIVVIAWMPYTHCLDIKNIKLSLGAYYKWNSLTLLNRRIPQDDFLLNANCSWPIYNYLTLNLTYSHFLPGSQESKPNILANKKRESNYNAQMLDVSVKYNIWNINYNALSYLEIGIWGLDVSIVDKFSVLKADKKAAKESRSFRIKGRKKTFLESKGERPSHHIGYGINIGVGLNWRFSASLSANCVASLYMPTSVPMLYPNHVSHIFPLLKGGVNWHIW
jgi:hypothetical protein